MTTRFELERRIEGAVQVGRKMAEGNEKHKAWVIDQMLRILLADKYDAAMEEAL